MRTFVLLVSFCICYLAIVKADLVPAEKIEEQLSELSEDNLAAHRISRSSLRKQGRLLLRKGDKGDEEYNEPAEAYKAAPGTGQSSSEDKVNKAHRRANKKAEARRREEDAEESQESNSGSKRPGRDSSSEEESRGSRRGSRRGGRDSSSEEESRGSRRGSSSRRGSRRESSSEEESSRRGGSRRGRGSSESSEVEARGHGYGELQSLGLNYAIPAIQEIPSIQAYGYGGEGSGRRGKSRHSRY